MIIVMAVANFLSSGCVLFRHIDLAKPCDFYAWNYVDRIILNVGSMSKHITTELSFSIQQSFSSSCHHYFQPFSFAIHVFSSIFQD